MNNAANIEKDIPLRRKKGFSSIIARAGKMKVLYIMLLLPLLFIFIFDYLPMYGLVISFKSFKYSDGILGSKWNDFKHYHNLFSDVLFRRVFWNTLKISISRILICFPAPILFAILLNEITRTKFKRVVQTISYLPHFMSWVVISGFVYQILSPEVGVFNYMLKLLGKEPVYLMIKSQYFLAVLIIALLWASVGWNSIIYLASITSIDTSMYESADMDGANRFHKAIYITLPSITPTITVLFIMQLGGILKAGFDPVFNLYNPMVYDVADVIDTYTFRKGLLEAKYDYAAAVGLFQNVIGFVLIYITNTVVRKVNEYGLW